MGRLLHRPTQSGLAKHDHAAHRGLLVYHTVQGIHAELGLLRVDVELLLHHHLNPVVRRCTHHRRTRIIRNRETTRQDFNRVLLPERVHVARHSVEERDRRSGRLGIHDTVLILR